MPSAQSAPPINLHTCPSETVRTRAGGREWAMERFADMETLWEALGTGNDPLAPLGGGCFEDDERLPYWCEIWPSSIALGDWIEEHAGAVSGKHCLDLGCGLGLTALIGAAVGARVTAMDYEWPALHYARRNAHTNLPELAAQALPRWVLMDWRTPAIRAASMDFIWGGDVLYEARFTEPVAEFLAHGLAAHGVAWIAEPGRTVYDAFPAVARTRGLHAHKVFTRPVGSAYTSRTACESYGESPVTPDQMAGPTATVNVWAISRKPGPATA